MRVLRYARCEKKQDTTRDHNCAITTAELDRNHRSANARVALLEQWRSWRKRDAKCRSGRLRNCDERHFGRNGTQKWERDCWPVSIFIGGAEAEGDVRSPVVSAESVTGSGWLLPKHCTILRGPSSCTLDLPVEDRARISFLWEFTFPRSF